MEESERSTDWAEEEVTGRDGIDGRFPFHKSLIRHYKYIN
jgi:hypothetical protein